MRAALLLITLSLAVLWAWLGQHPALIADALTLAEVWQGLRTGAGLGPWLFSTAPSLFPDLGVTALATKLSADLVGAQRWHGFFLGVGLGWGAARLMQQLWGLPKWQARSFAAAGLTLGLVMAPSDGFMTVLAPGHHGWACVTALWAWTWALKQEEDPGRRWPSLSLMLFWGLTLASDRFLLLWALLPIFFLGLRYSTALRVRLWGTLLGAWAVSVLALQWLKGTGAKVGVFRWDYAEAHTHELWMTFKSAGPALVHAHTWALILVALGVALWLGASFRAARPAWAFGAWVVALVGSLGICLLAGPYGRYLLLPFWLLMLMTPALLAMRWPWLGPASLLGPALLGLLWLARPFNGEAPLELRQAAWMDQMAEQRGLSYGASDYFHSRPLRLFSRRSLMVVPVLTPASDVMVPHLWVVDRRVFPQDQLQARPQFVVMNDLDPAAVSAALGKPKEVLQSEGLELWVYKEHR